MAIRIKMAGVGNSGQTLNDRLNAARYALAGQGLARVVCKATTEEMIAPKKKHIDCKYTLILLTRDNQTQTQTHSSRQLKLAAVWGELVETQLFLLFPARYFSFILLNFTTPIVLFRVFPERHCTHDHANVHRVNFNRTLHIGSGRDWKNTWVLLWFVVHF